MKVVCIDDSWHSAELKEIKESYFWGFYTVSRHEKVAKAENGPTKGDVLEVTAHKKDIANFEDKIVLYYKFKEWQDWYDAKAFRPIDQTEESEADKKIEELLQTK